MNYNVVPTFPSSIIQVNVEEDTSELLDDGDDTVTAERRRILEKYPRTREILLNAFTLVAEKVIGYKKRDYEITTSWISYMDKGEQSLVHNHKNSFWSCVYYFQSKYPEGTGAISFVNPNIDRMDFYYSDDDIESPNLINGMKCSLTPKPNLLLIFPSYLEHQVLHHNNDTPRCSLAFNIIPLGTYGLLNY
tara:strand:- start:640 stop:1212 length:573 start_codon:yes stop_codon:yes gene_type:complete